MASKTLYDTTWIDLQHPTEAQFRELKQDYGLHPVHIKESVQKVQHTRVERESQYLFLVLHIPHLDRGSHKIMVGQVGIFLGKDFLITIRSAACDPIVNLFEAGDEDVFKKGSAFVLYSLISNILAEIADITDLVTSQLDDIEDLVFDNRGSDAQRIGELRQKIIRLRRVIGPKRILLDDLAEQIDSFAGKSMSKYYSNNTKTVARLWEVIEEAKETVEIYKDADFTTSTEQTNGILAVLTLLFTFTIPVTVIGTLYGMNVPLPGGNEAGPWTFLGRYTTAIVIVAISAVAAFGMYAYSKKKHWV